jgi:DNA-binding GntR family transcriptional regulator
MLKESANLMERAYTLLKAMIFKQKIGPGQKIIYRDLTKRLSMSKTPILYALGRLEQEGFVTLQPNLGYFVKEIDLKELEDSFGVREALEVYAIGLAIKNQNDADIKKLEEKMIEHRNYQNPVYDRKKLVMDAEVHLQIAQMSRNKFLIKQLHHVLEHHYLRYRAELMNPSRMSVAPPEHREILSRIKKRDYSGANRTIRNHIRKDKENMLSSFSKEEDLSELCIPLDYNFKD